MMIIVYKIIRWIRLENRGLLVTFIDRLFFKQKSFDGTFWHHNEFFVSVSLKFGIFLKTRYQCISSYQTSFLNISFNNNNKKKCPYKTKIQNKLQSFADYNDHCRQNDVMHLLLDKKRLGVLVTFSDRPLA